MSQSPYKGFNSHDLVHEFVEESSQSPYKGFNRKKANSVLCGGGYQSPYKGFNSYAKVFESLVDEIVSTPL